MKTKGFKCIRCGSTIAVKHAKGMCHKCYNLNWIKNNSKRWNEHCLKYSKTHRDVCNKSRRKWILKRFGSYSNYSLYLGEMRLLKEAKKFFHSSKDAKIFVYGDVDLDTKLGVKEK
jgi:hypothetical protein